MTPAERIIHDRIRNAIVERLDEHWPHIRLHLAVHEACQWLRDGAPGRALEVLEAALEKEEPTARKP